MKFTVQQIADLLQGEVKGDPNLEVYNLAKIDEEAPEGSICFLANPKYENYIYQTTANAVIVKNDFQPRKEINTTLVLVEDPYTAFTKLLEEYEKLLNRKQSRKKGIEQPSFVSDSATLGEDVYVGAFAYIGNNCVIGKGVQIYPHAYIGDNVQIGDFTVIHPQVKLYHHTQIANHCTIHAGAIIGCEGFGFAPQNDGTYRNIPQLGNVIIEERVNIGANTTIDRATIGSTIIRKGVKLDNLIQVGHNVEIGENTVISAQTGISGSSKIGKNCMIGGQVGFANSLQVADGTKIGAQSGINNNIKEEGRSIQGYPAFDYMGFMKSSVLFRKLPDLFRRVEQIEDSLKKQ